MYVFATQKSYINFVSKLNYKIKKDGEKLCSTLYIYETSNTIFPYVIKQNFIFSIPYFLK